MLLLYLVKRLIRRLALYLRINLPSFLANPRCIGHCGRLTYVSFPLSDISQASRLRYTLRRPRFWLLLAPNHVSHTYPSPHTLEILISVARTLVSDRNFSSQTELLAYLTVSCYDLLLNGLHDAFRIPRYYRLHTVYCDVLPCHLTLA